MYMFILEGNITWNDLFQVTDYRTDVSVLFPTVWKCLKQYIIPECFISSAFSTTCFVISWSIH